MTTPLSMVRAGRIDAEAKHVPSDLEADEASGRETRGGVGN
jgi:hypothetical protein